MVSTIGMEKLAAEDPRSLPELNSAINGAVRAINEVVDLRVARDGIEDSIRHLKELRDMYARYLSKVRFDIQEQTEGYLQLFQNPAVALKEVDKIYDKLNAKWPSLEPSQWSVPPPFELPEIRRPHRPFRLHSWTQSVSTGCTHLYRKGMRRYHYHPQISRSSAIAKLATTEKKLYEAMADKTGLEAAIESLQMEEHTLKQEVSAFEAQITSPHLIFDTMVSYQQYRKLALQRFETIRHEERRTGLVHFPEIRVPPMDAQRDLSYPVFVHGVKPNLHYDPFGNDTLPDSCQGRVIRPDCTPLSPSSAVSLDTDIGFQSSTPSDITNLGPDYLPTPDTLNTIIANVDVPPRF